MTEEEKKLRKEVEVLRNPFNALCDICNRLVDKFDDNLTFKDPQEIIKEAYEEQRMVYKKKMKTIMEGLTEITEDTEELLKQANKLINPDEE